ncbi:hypothetical protein M0638_19495 [Roseomonas sp. NAR14]|uniref:Lipoprotein n=1 Tax=Roseomonas acroporae TaxID=2937791 RepID=A0A9X1Y9T5_9PROT|nr:hypothetical protein [Roseomonas acroporae]MCK8786564.1 hypothetical protein [Roseomonas acroporae]
MKSALIALAAAAALAACSSAPPSCRGEVFPLNPGRVTAAADLPLLPAEAAR